LTQTTIAKARGIYKGGGVENPYPGLYFVTSTSGREYRVTLKNGCECPSATTCGHEAAVELYRSARRKRVGGARRATA